MPNPIDGAGDKGFETPSAGPGLEAPGDSTTRGLAGGREDTADVDMGERDDGELLSAPEDYEEPGAEGAAGEREVDQGTVQQLGDTAARDEVGIEDTGAAVDAGEGVSAEDGTWDQVDVPRQPGPADADAAAGEGTADAEAAADAADDGTAEAEEGKTFVCKVPVEDTGTTEDAAGGQAGEDGTADDQALAPEGQRGPADAATDGGAVTDTENADRQLTDAGAADAAARAGAEATDDEHAHQRDGADQGALDPEDEALRPGTAEPADAAADEDAAEGRDARGAATEQEGEAEPGVDEPEEAGDLVHDHDTEDHEAVVPEAPVALADPAELETEEERAGGAEPEERTGEDPEVADPESREPGLGEGEGTDHEERPEEEGARGDGTDGGTDPEGRKGPEEEPGDGTGAGPEPEADDKHGDEEADAKQRMTDGLAEMYKLQQKLEEEGLSEDDAAKIGEQLDALKDQLNGTYKEIYGHRPGESTQPENQQSRNNVPAELLELDPRELGQLRDVLQQRLDNQLPNRETDPRQRDAAAPIQQYLDNIDRVRDHHQTVQDSRGLPGRIRDGIRQLSPAEQQRAGERAQMLRRFLRGAEVAGDVPGAVEGYVKERGGSPRQMDDRLEQRLQEAERRRQEQLPKRRETVQKELDEADRQEEKWKDREPKPQIRGRGNAGDRGGDRGGKRQFGDKPKRPEPSKQEKQRLRGERAQQKMAVRQAKAAYLRDKAKHKEHKARAAEIASKISWNPFEWLSHPFHNAALMKAHSAALAAAKSAKAQAGVSKLQWKEAKLARGGGVMNSLGHKLLDKMGVAA